MKKLFILMLFLIFSCTIMDDPHFSTDPLMRPYVDTFFNQAKLRGLNIKPQYLIIHAGNLDHAGARTYYRTNKIVIDTTKTNWKFNPEAVVFHELGHLCLGRDHDNNTMGGESVRVKYPKSIMSNQMDPNYKIRPYQRDYYINELFDPDTPEPYWVDFEN